MLTLFTVLSVVWVFAESFLGFLYLSERAGQARRWTRGRQAWTAVFAWLLLVGLCAVVAVKTSKAKAVVDKQTLLELREIASRAYERGDYSSTVRLMSWAIQFNDNEESFYRVRARAYKRMGEYRKDLDDRKRVFQLNPARELNHLSIIEDFVLLRKCHHARAWIAEHQNSIKGPDEKTMFRFFSLVCSILEHREYSSEEKEFRESISQHPMTRHFVDKFWEWETLMTFVGNSSISEQSKDSVRELIKVMREGSK